jgi:hypothetical protein
MSKTNSGLKPTPLYACSLVNLMKTPSIRDYEETMLAKCMEQESLFDNAQPFNPLQAMLKLSLDNAMSHEAKAFTVKGYKFAILPASHPENFIAIFDERTNEFAGGVHWRNLIVRKPHQGKGIGTELFIMAFELGIFHPSTFLSENRLSKSGRSTLTRAHRVAVERALAAGEKVPPHVLGRYRSDIRRTEFRNQRIEKNDPSLDGNQGDVIRDRAVSWIRRGIEFDCKIALGKLSMIEMTGSKYPDIIEIASNALDKFLYMVSDVNSETLEVEKEKLLAAIYNFAFSATDNYMDADSVKRDLMDDILSKHSPRFDVDVRRDIGNQRFPGR